MKTIEDITQGCDQTPVDDSDIAEALATAMAMDFVPSGPPNKVEACRAGIQNFLSIHVGSCFNRASLKDSAVQETIMHAAARTMGWKHRIRG